MQWQAKQPRDVEMLKSEPVQLAGEARTKELGAVPHSIPPFEVDKTIPALYPGLGERVECGER